MALVTKESLKVSLIPILNFRGVKDWMCQRMDNQDSWILCNTIIMVWLSDS